MECANSSSESSEQRSREDIYTDFEYIGLSDLGYVLRRRADTAEKNYQYDEAEELYLQSIRLGNIHALNSLAIFYEQNYYPVRLIEDTYLSAIAVHEDSDPIYNLADFYKNRKDYNKMVKYLKMAILRDGDIECILLLALYYKNKNSIRNANKYFKMAFEDEEIDANDSTQTKYNFKFVLSELLTIIEYCKAKKIGETNRVYKYIMKLFNQNEKIVVYNTKMALFTRLNNMMDCGVCLEEKININLNCGHCVCGECYLKLLNSPCPFCRAK